MMTLRSLLSITLGSTVKADDKLSSWPFRAAWNTLTVEHSNQILFGEAWRAAFTSARLKYNGEVWTFAKDPKATSTDSNIPVE